MTTPVPWDAPVSDPRLVLHHVTCVKRLNELHIPIDERLGLVSRRNPPPNTREKNAHRILMSGVHGA
jgi:hypothetical protein